jgi:hypothetical protein
LIKRKLTKIEIYALTALMVIGCFYVYLTYAYKPARAALSQVRQELARSSAEIARHGGVPPSTQKAKENLEKLEEDTSVLEKQLEHVQNTRKAGQEVTVTQAMAEINRLANNNNLIFKLLKFEQRIDIKGAKKEEKPAKKTSKRRSQDATKAAEEAAPGTVTSAVYYPWQEYTLVVNGSHDGLVGFMRDLSRTNWVVSVDELSVKVPADDKKKKTQTTINKEGMVKTGEFETTLKITL